MLDADRRVGVDHAFVCIDPPATLLPAFRATAKAGNVVVTAITPDTVKQIDIPPLELFATQKAVMGAVYGFMSPRLQIPELLRLYRTGELEARRADHPQLSRSTRSTAAMKISMPGVTCAA